MNKKNKNILFLSIIAGKKINFFQKNLNYPNQIIRAMPNMPALVEKGITCFVANKNIVKKNKKIVTDNNTLVAALLIHAAKIDENYTDIEKKIIKKALMNLNNINSEQAEELLKNAEKKEKEDDLEIPAFLRRQKN